MASMMPYASTTPEAQVSRSDSKDPATTCRGLTSNGIPCRRSIAAAAKRDLRLPSVNRRLSLDASVDVTFAYCWQHRDQAQHVIDNASRSAGAPVAPKRRGSIDTLISRFGLLEVDDSLVQPLSKRPIDKTSSPRAKAVNSGPGVNTSVSRHSSRPPAIPTKEIMPSTLWKSLCCMGNPQNDDYLEIVKHKSRIQNMKDSGAMEAPRLSTQPQSQYRRVHLPVQKAQPFRLDLPTPTSHISEMSLSGNMFSMLPRSLSPQTTSSLLAELVKPISPFDSPGYIYIFWLTPLASSLPSNDLTTSLLSNSVPNFNANSRQREILKPFTTDPNDRKSAVGAPTKGKLLLKIGRTSNVHRRLTQWSRQCDYTLSLIRWYPYIPSIAAGAATPTRKSFGSPTTTAPTSPQKTPSNPSQNTSTAPSTIHKSSLSPTGSTTPIHSTVSSRTTISNPPMSQPVPAKARFALPANPIRSSSTPAPAPPLAPSYRTTSSPLLSPAATRRTHLQTRASTGTIPTFPLSDVRSGGGGGSAPPKVPHAHRTERLIHIELADCRAKLGPCTACGREHREWFEVEASRAGVKGVDDVVRRWVEWGLREGGAVAT